MKFNLISFLLGLVSANTTSSLDPKKRPSSMYRKHRPRWSGNTQCVSSVFGADYDEIAKEDV